MDRKNLKKKKKLAKNQEIDPLDVREYKLSWFPPLYDVMASDVEILITQRELRLILKHVNNRNKHISQKLECFIRRVDKIDKRETDWESYVPKTHNIFNY